MKSRPAKELYDRMVTEMWFSIREFVEADMIRNLDKPQPTNLLQPDLGAKGTGQGRRIAIQKKDMKCFRVPPTKLMRCRIWSRFTAEKGINARPSAPARTLNDREVRKVEEEMDWDALPDLYAEEYV
jgi:hypothetical protein